MRYELAHDSLARQILDRVSGEAKARRQAELLVARAYKRYTERQILLTQEDLDEIRPHEKAISFKAVEKQFIQDSKNALAKAARRKRQMVSGVIAMLSLFLFIALWQWQRSVAGKKALMAKAAYEDGRISKAFQLARSARNTIGVDQDTKETIQEVLQDIYQSGLQKDLIHTAKVKNLDINPKEEYILSITESPAAYIWDLQGKLRYQLEHPAEVLDGGFIPWEENREVMTIAGDSTAYFWDGSGNLVREFRLEAPILGFDFNDRHQLTLLWTQKDIALLDKEGQSWSFQPNWDNFIKASFSPNDDDLLLVTPDSVSSWWLEFIKFGRPVPRLKIPGKIKWADYVRSDQVQLQILIQFQDSTSQVYDAQGLLDETSYYQYLNEHLSNLPYIKRFDFSPPGVQKPKILFQTDSSSVRYWSAYRSHTDGGRVGVIDFYTRYDQAILNTTFGDADQYLLTAAADGRVDIWDISRPTIERFKRWRAQIRLARFARENSYLISSPLNQKIQIWQVDRKDEKTVPEIVDYFKDNLEVLNKK